MIPDTYIKLEGQAANTMIRLMEALEDSGRRAERALEL